MWLQISSIAFVVGSVVLFAWNFRKVLRIVMAGAKENRWKNIGQRIWTTIDQVFLHRKLLRKGVAGIIHLVIFWGFIILSLGTLEWLFHGVTGGMKFSIFGDAFYSVFLLSQDLLNSLVLIAVLVAVFRRIFVAPKRMADNSVKSKADAYFILGLIGLLVLSSLMAHSVAISRGVESSYAAWQPVGNAISSLYGDFQPGETAYYFWWWVHLIIIFGFLNFLPFSKHLHVIVAAPNVFFGKTSPRGQLSTLDLEDESIERFGAEKVEELKWKNLLDSFACTECGRCNEFCPTASTGKALKPKTLMIDLRAAASERAPLYSQMTDGNLALDQLSEEDKKLYEQNLVPDVFSDQFVWDCTTCGACVEACPVMIDHVDSIVEMRRALVLNKGSNPDEATNAFRNWETNSNPWGLPEASRQEWLVEKGIPIFDPEKDFDYLYYIGCAGSFDERNKKVVDSVVAILQKAGVKFGILGKEEKCNGETARRMGNEWIAQQMIQTNLELLQGKMVKNVITSCPHCFNTLANEYPAFGGEFNVIHHTELIDQLIKESRIQVDQSQEGVSYHDSCYIGRYNKIYDQPRDAIKAVSKDKPIELERSREKGFCCGAGGGRMWLEETTGSRINENRAQEIVESGAKTVGVACPFCMTMITDGLRTQEREDIQVRDVAELVAESMR